jgi:hypothetical protein
VGISVAFDDATDCRCHRGQLVGGEVNRRHGPDISGRQMSSKQMVIIIIIGAGTLNFPVGCATSTV